jgi:hypothetical protein
LFPHAGLAGELNEVEEVLDMGVIRDRKEYFVKYAGLPIIRCEWVLPNALEHTRDNIEFFEHETAARSIGKRKRGAEIASTRKKKSAQPYGDWRRRQIVWAIQCGTSSWLLRCVSGYLLHGGAMNEGFGQLVLR